jgi:hypothetical protein
MWELSLLDYSNQLRQEHILQFIDLVQKSLLCHFLKVAADLQGLVPVELREVAAEGHHDSVQL